MEAKIWNGNLVITLPLEDARPSASGKNLLVASSRGPRRTTARVNGEIVYVIVNAFIKEPGNAKAKNTKKKLAPGE